MSELVATPIESQPKRAVRRQQGQRRTSLFTRGEPMVWLTGGALAICLAMIVGMLVLVVYQGALTFWPVPVVQVETLRGTRLMGEVAQIEEYRPGPDVFENLPAELAPAARARVAENGGVSERRMLRTENFELTGTHYTWVSDFEIARESLPAWALVIERRENGRFYGLPKALLVDGQAQASEPDKIWSQLEQDLGPIALRVEQRERIKKDEIGAINARLDDERLELRKVELEHGAGSSQWKDADVRYQAVQREVEQEFLRLRIEIDSLDAQNSRYELLVSTADGQEQRIPLAEIVHVYPANQVDFGEKLGVYASRVREFICDDPRESNTEGGVMPAIFGTVSMTLIMALLVAPFGVLAALYLREYAKPGPVVSVVRIAINNLAGVPSIVFGVFGLGFFCYIMGASVDELFYPASLPTPTFGTGGILWASLTLALLTLPVVIVPTEEALAAVPSSMREGSYACGATKWQTIRRIVLPRAMPGIMTGMILAIARGAGEVAPLMLVGAVKLAPELPIDGELPYVHPSRSFMHLGFHIYDLGFQSPNSEAAKPMVYTTTLLLIGIVVMLNVIAIWVRARLRRRFQGVQV